MRRGRLHRRGDLSRDFDDVPPSAFAYNFINEIHALGITGGCSLVPPLYCPTGLVNRGQMAAFVVRAFLEPAP